MSTDLDKRILLTGSSSYIGRSYINSFNQNSNQQIISTYRKNRPTTNKKNVYFRKFDLFSNENKNVYQKFGKPDTLIHLAWDFLPDYDHINHIKKNYFYSYKFIFELIKSGCKNINIIGTHQEAGDMEGKIPENFINFVGKNNYAIGKQMLYYSVNELKKKYNFNFKWIRIFNLYGRGNNRGLFNQLHNKTIKNINLTDGRQKIDFIHIDECVNKIKVISKSKKSGVYNLGSGKAIKLKQFIESYKINNKINKVTNYGKIKYEGPNRYFAETTNVKNLTKKNFIRVSQSYLDNNEIINVEKTIKSNFLGLGKEVSIFEDRLIKFIGNKNKNIVCVNSGTSALQIAIESLKLPIGSEIILPSLTFFASCQAIIAAKMQPVICDIDLNNAVIDPKDLEKKITKKTKAIMPVHYASSFGELDIIYKIAKKYNLRVIEDAAHSFGSLYKGKRVGYYGDIICFSFDGIKNITSGEGGAVVTSNKILYKNLRILRNLGISVNKKNNKIDVDSKLVGGRFHMNNIHAAIGIEQLKKINDIAKKRKYIASLYQNQLSSIKQIKFLNINYSKEKIIPHIVPILILNHKRNNLQKFLVKNNIETRTNYYPLNKLSLFKKNRFKCPNAEKFSQQVLTLPIHPDLNDSELKFITNKIKMFFNQ